MNRSRLFELAQQAGFKVEEGKYPGVEVWESEYVSLNVLDRFAKLVVAEIEYAKTNARLSAENAELRAKVAFYAPAQRTERNLEPVKAVGPCNFEFWRIIESDEEFAERAGTKIAEEE